MAPKFSVTVDPDSVLMSAAKRPGAPEVRVRRELRWSVMRGSASTRSIMSAMPGSSGCGRSTSRPLGTSEAAARKGTRL